MVQVLRQGSAPRGADSVARDARSILTLGCWCGRCGVGVNGLLLPLLVVGISSVLWWAWTESAGAGDLRFYGLVQFLPVVLIPLMLFMYPVPRYFIWFMVALALFYILAKVLEIVDHQVYHALGGVVSGHALKHLVAAGATACVLVMLYRHCSYNRDQRS